MKSPEVNVTSILFKCYEEVCKSIEERVQKTLLWKNAKPSLPGSPCNCPYHGVAPHGIAAAAVTAVQLPSARHTGTARSNSNTNDSNNSRKFQHPYTGPFKLLKKAGEKAFVFDIPAHWCLYPVFNVARLKPSRVDRSRKHPPPPPLRSTAMVEYEVRPFNNTRATRSGTSNTWSSR